MGRSAHRRRRRAASSRAGGRGRGSRDHDDHARTDDHAAPTTTRPPTTTVATTKAPTTKAPTTTVADDEGADDDQGADDDGQADDDGADDQGADRPPRCRLRRRVQARAMPAGTTAEMWLQLRMCESGSNYHAVELGRRLPGCVPVHAGHLEHDCGLGAVADPPHRRGSGDRGARRSRRDGVHALRACEGSRPGPFAARNCRDGGRPPEMTYSRREIQSMLAEIGVRPRKSLGQNFVADPNLVRRIARLAEITPGDRVDRDRRRAGLVDVGARRGRRIRDRDRDRLVVGEQTARQRRLRTRRK